MAKLNLKDGLATPELAKDLTGAVEAMPTPITDVEVWGANGAIYAHLVSPQAAIPVGPFHGIEPLIAWLQPLTKKAAS